MHRRSLHAAFTLIELLVVISIIAILAGAALPVYNGVILNGKMAAATGQARQIGIALRMYAGDNDGSLPSASASNNSGGGQSVTTSNDAFRVLIPAYLDTEKVFTVAGSKAGATADDEIGSPSQILQRGENHWAYISGLSNTSKSNMPLIVDHTNGSGYYTDRENTFGGTWKGTKAIVVAVDGSASQVRLMGKGDRRFIPRAGDKNKNALETSYMGDDVKLLEPTR